MPTKDPALRRAKQERKYARIKEERRAARAQRRWHTLKSEAIDASIMLLALPRGRELKAGPIGQAVREDYGSITDRTILRHLADLVARGLVFRTGRPKDYTYRRAR